MSISKENIYNYCRTCMKQLKALKFDIFEKFDLPQWLIMYSFLEVDKSDALSQYICKTCHRKIDDIFDFRKLCLESTQKYREILNKTESSDDIKTEYNQTNQLEITSNDDIKIEIAPVIEKVDETSLSPNNNEDNTQFSELKFEVNKFENDPLHEQNYICSFEASESRQADDNNENLEIKETSLDKKTRRKDFKYVYSDVEEEPIALDLCDTDIKKKDLSKKVKRKRMICKVCGKCFSNKEKFKACWRKHQGLKPYPCSQCEKGYSTLKDLKFHESASHSDDPVLYSCPIRKCGASYKVFSSLQKHCRRTHKASYNTIKAQQPEVEENIENDENKKDNDEEKSNDDCDDIEDENSTGNPNSKICELCNKKHKNSKYQEMCIKRHAGIKCHFCSTCGKSFLTKSLLIKHISCRHTESSILYKCEFEGCDKTFINKTKLENHCKSTHLKKHINTNRVFICPDCGKSFKKNGTLTNHLYIHTGNFPFKCDKCPLKGFSRRSELESHQKRHDGIRNCACDLCDYKCVTKSELRMHKNRHHMKDRVQYNCSYCEFKTFNKFQVKQHENVVHFGIRKYKCQYCDGTFGKPHQLKYHMMTHTGERPIQCKLCPKRFIQPQALKVHLKAHARGTVRSS